MCLCFPTIDTPGEWTNFDIIGTIIYLVTCFLAATLTVLMVYRINFRYRDKECPQNNNLIIPTYSDSKQIWEMNQF
jgi:hypothetical protein